MGELNVAALSMTDALVQRDVDRITLMERKLESNRILHDQARRKRLAMQRQGFGDLTIEQVCNYAPGAVRRGFQQLSRDLTIKSISLAITLNNNKTLIQAGMDRLRNTVQLIHDSMTESTGTYKRRGIVPKAQGSVIVSRRA